MHHQLIDNIEDPIAELAAIERELQRLEYAEDAPRWVRERLQEFTWSKQNEIFAAVRDHRKTLVQSCHQVGKSWWAGRLAAHWLDTHPVGQAFVVTTAPSNSQVKTILWKEIGRAYTKGKLLGRVNQTEWYMEVNGKEEIVAFGRKPDDYDPTAFQGIHAIYVLIIVDEANGVRGPLHEAAESLIANDDGKIVMIGNPDDPAGEFFENSKPGSGWHVINISAFDSPNFTGEPVPPLVAKQLIGRVYVEEKRRKWAPHWKWTEDGRACVPPPGVDPVTDANANPLWKSKILGIFPEKTQANGLIPIAWIKAAQLRDLSSTEKDGPHELGADIGAGGDDTVIVERKGCVYRVIREDNDPDTMSQTGKIIVDLRTTGATSVKIDKIGIGWGIVNRGQEQNKPFIGINVGEGATEDETASDERFLNLKAELFWNLRNLFERGMIDLDPEDDDTAAELVSIRYETLSNGKIKIADKRRDENNKLIPSPNRAEAIMLAAAPDTTQYVVGELEVEWG
jgi:hypothetical protein